MLPKTVAREVRRSKKFVGAFIFWILVSFYSADSVDADPRDPAERIAFDIPGQPLDKAIHFFAIASNHQILYETALSSGQRSTELKGVFTPGVALSVLLTGTGLVGRRTDIDAFTISAMEQGPAAAATIPDGRFLGAVQSGILGALCRSPRTWPGEYKVAVQLWIASSGAVEGAALVGSTGEAGRDAVLLDALRDVVIDMRPPPGMPQPVTMAIVPRTKQETEDCLHR